MPCNFFVTGEKGIGKSFLIRRLMEAWQGKCHGFLTLPYTIEGKRKGFYLHSLQKPKGIENDLPVSVQWGETTCFPITETFERLGCAALDTVYNKEDLVIMDELGRLEGQAFLFQQAVERILDGENMTFCVVKKEDVPFLNRIRGRKDVCLLDLDRNVSEKIYEELKREMDRVRKRGYKV